MLRWHIGWFLAGFGSNKSLRLPPVPLLWTPMDLIDLEHVVDGLIKCLEAHKVLQVSRNGEKTGWKKVKGLGDFRADVPKTGITKIFY